MNVTKVGGLISNLLSRPIDDYNLGPLSKELKPNQGLVNILLDKVKLVGGLTNC